MDIGLEKIDSLLPIQWMQLGEAYLCITFHPDIHSWVFRHRVLPVAAVCILEPRGVHLLRWRCQVPRRVHHGRSRHCLLYPQATYQLDIWTGFDNRFVQGWSDGLSRCSKHLLGERWLSVFTWWGWGSANTGNCWYRVNPQSFLMHRIENCWQRVRGARQGKWYLRKGGEV